MDKKKTIALLKEAREELSTIWGTDHAIDCIKTAIAEIEKSDGESLPLNAPG